VVPVHLARHAAEHTRDLAPEAAAHADRLLTRAPTQLSQRRIKDLVDEARLYHDPDRAIDDEQHALASRKVALSPGNTPATTDVVMVLDTADAVAFDASVAGIADQLAKLGDPDDLEIRRARAVGVLADPHRALALLHPGEDPGSRPSPPATLWLHLSDTVLDLDTPRRCRAQRTPRRPATDLLKTWLADTTLIIKPVLHLDRRDAVDTHDPPPWMADLVRLRDPACVFPGCHRSSRACDLDHIDPYHLPDQGGPPGQTHPGNLAPLCRHHHRAKTHTHWHYHRHPDGSYRWTSPIGRTVDVPPPDHSDPGNPGPL
jgi:hypothetical protein